MKKTSCILLVFAAAMMLFASGCASADMTDGLIYDETDNTWAAADEDLTEFVSIMKRECTKSPLIKGTYRNHPESIQPAVVPISMLERSSEDYGITLE